MPSRRAVAITVALAALLVPATAADAATKKKRKKVAQPVVTAISPQRVFVNETLNIHGRNFTRGKGVNTVVFKRAGQKAVFVRADVSTTKLIRVVIPKRIEDFLVVASGTKTPTRFRVKVLAKRLSRFYTRTPKSPIVGPEKPPAPPKPPGLDSDGDCDGDGIKNSVETDADDDLLANDREKQLGLDACKADTDGDGVEDGYEYQSAQDLNDDDSRQPNDFLPYPGKRPYPNPLDGSDAGIDFDGDVLTLAEEYALWKYTIKNDGATRTLNPLTYSDGEQYSLSARGSDGRRRPTQGVTSYLKHQQFVDWAAANGYRRVMLSDGPPWWAHETTRHEYGLFDFNRNGSESTAPDASFRWSELWYFDHDNDGFISDDERDEDADGLTNYDETHGRMQPAYWAGCYSQEKAYRVAYAGTSHVDADSDGDGVLDGADDQDHDDIPNVMELSRNAASGLWDGKAPCRVADGVPTEGNHEAAYGWVNPFNPCLPATWSRTCERHPSEATGAPYTPGTPVWWALN